jgi:hypothetical protein
MSADIQGLAPDVQHILNEARELVSQLYSPENAGNPAEIKFIQERLQSLQKGPEAWLIANDLLSANSTDMRFFGALTFTVKINLDWYVTNRNICGVQLSDIVAGRNSTSMMLKSFLVGWLATMLYLSTQASALSSFESWPQPWQPSS